jgi:hypothetical protein
MTKFSPIQTILWGTALSLGVLGVTATATLAGEDQDDKLFSGLIMVGTEGIQKGLGNTNQEPAWMVNGEVGRGHYFGGASLFNTYSNGTDSAESQIYLGYKRKVWGNDLKMRLLYRTIYDQPDTYDNDMWELETTVTRYFGQSYGRVKVVLTDDNYGTGEEGSFAELSGGHTVYNNTVVSGGYGVRTVENGVSYSTLNLGVSYSLTPSALVDLRYYDTNKDDVSEKYMDRTVLTLSSKF